MIDQIIAHTKQTKMKMKLNLRPNDRYGSANRTSFWPLQNFALSSFPLISILVITVNCVQLPIPQHQNEVPHDGHVTTSHNSTSKLHRGEPNLPASSLAPPRASSLTESPQRRLAAPNAKPDLDVKEFRLTSDFRAVKLRWSYEHTDANEPAAFTVRFCELTSWNVEIKCRQHDLQVDSSDPSAPADARQQANSVITGGPSRASKPSIDMVRLVDPPRGSHYETHIYDLRALTNYTFQVRVARFSHEPPVALAGQQPGDRSQAARRLGGSAPAARQELDWPPAEEGSSRVETKPFGAEATKCLSDVSEVVVNTGRYFGGRISVENSADPRCNLLGNKSSEQTSYLFRIEHEICDSKVVDGNRIETMVLVHENKDILTHNTARFLVLCNFLQKSFTLRASISLPKVNGLIAQSRPAVITSLPRRPENSSAPDERATSVLLGSMPGIYRARAVHQSGDEPEQAKPASSKATEAAHANSSASKGSLVDELETNTIEKTGGKNGRPVGEEQQLFGAPMRRRNSNGADRARALTLSSADSQAAGSQLVPQPVQVQSKVLFVERGADMARTGRRHHYNRLSATSVGGGQSAPNGRLDTVEVLQRAAPTVAVAASSTTPSADGDKSLRLLKQSAERTVVRSSPAEDDDPQTASITMTNNHRISGDYPPIGSLNTKPLNDNNNNTSNYSIKYSALARIDDYPVGGARPSADEPPLPELQSEGASQMRSLLMRVRSGRMRSVGEGGEQRRLSPEQQADLPVSRMGEMSTDNNGDLLAETSNESAARQQVVAPAMTHNTTLAQNITSYLLKWSLKTLTNLAKKSLETLIDNQESGLVRANETELLVGGPPSEAQLTPNSGDNSDHELRISGRPLEPVNSRQFAQAPPARRSDPPAQVDARTKQGVGAINETGSASPAPAKPEGLAEPAKPSEGLLDGFLTSKSAQTKARAKPVHPEPTRPSNYSKSIDFGRAETLAKTRAGGERTKQVHAPIQRHKASHPSAASTGSPASTERHEQANAPHWNESAWSARDGSILSASWLFCSIGLLVALITGIFLTFWLVSAPSRSSASVLEQQINGQRGDGAPERSPIAFNNPTLPGLVHQFNDNPNSSGGGTADVSYQKYDYNKFDNYPNEAINNHKVNLLPTVGAKMGRPSAQSPSTESQSTRSTSAGSTLLAADENDCKNNEFLYTGHVLLNTGSSLGESYA